MATELQDRPTGKSSRYDDDYFRHIEQSPSRESTDEEAAIERARKLARPAHNPVSSSSKPKARAQKIIANFRGNRSKSPILLIIILLFGGGSIFTAILAPGATLLSLADTLERDLNSQLSAMDKTSMQVWRTKLKQTTSGSCGAVKIKCKFATVNKTKFDKAVQRANAAGPDKFKISYDDSKGFGENRARIKEITWTSEAGEVHRIKGGDEFTKMMKENPSFRAKMFLVHNPRFSPFKGKPVMEFLAKNKTSYAKKLKGKNEKEVRASKTQAIKGESTIEVKKLTPVTDEDGNQTGEYEDDKGNKYSADEAKGLIEQEERIKKIPSTQKILGGMAKGVLITGLADTACTVYNTSRAVSVGAKTLRSAELIRTSMVYTNEAHAIRAEMATPETVQVASNDIMYMEPRSKVADENQLATTPAGQKLPEIDNPNGGKTGMDSPIYKISSSQDYPKNLSASTQTLMPGGGLTGTLDSVNLSIANALGASDPATISQRCKVIQNPIVRGGSLIIGIAAGLGSFGTSTAFSMAGSMALALALPYLTAQLADMIAGNVTDNLKGMDLVSAVSIGSALTYNGMARSQGMMTMSPEDMADYQNGKRQALVAYDEIDQIAARKNPFDVTNQFSFAGSLIRSSLPVAATIRSSGAGVLQALPQIASLAASAIVPSANAADTRRTLVRPERYTMCNDQDYKALGENVAVDVTCTMNFGLPKEAMNLEVDDAVDYMVANDEIDAADESGAPKENERSWNYAKYVEQCVKNQPGATEDAEAEPTNGAGCTSKANYEKNWHYAKFEVIKNSSDYIDQELPGMDGGSREEFDDGSKSSIGMDGWAYPTDKNKTTISSGFGPRDGAQHNGTDLAGPLGTPIYAARDGEVIAAGPADGFGNWIVLQHDANGKRVDTVYGHMQRSGVLVRVGQKVKAGEMIGRIGNEGQSTGPHLHFEVWDGGRSDMPGGDAGKAVDPAPFLEKASSGDSSSNARNI